jgi:hypothetical protein
VTKFVVKTYPVDKVWVGIRLLNCTRDEFNDALQDYIANMNKYPKVATLVPVGTPSMGMGRRSLFGSLGGLFGISRNTEVSQIQDAMDAVSGRSLFNLGSSLQSELLEDSRDSAAPGRRLFSIGMAYVDEKKPPKEAWGKTFNALPLVKESGSMVSYHDAVYQLFDI